MKIEVLFPEICNLYADLQNIEYLRRSAKGSIEVIDTGLRDRPAFADSEFEIRIGIPEYSLSLNYLEKYC